MAQKNIYNQQFDTESPSPKVAAETDPIPKNSYSFPPHSLKPKLKPPNLSITQSDGS